MSEPMTLHKALHVIRNPWNQQHEKRVAELWLCDEVERLSRPGECTSGANGASAPGIAGTPAKPKMRSETGHKLILAALEAAEEYFESRADAEYFTDRAAPVGNKEMHLLVEMREAIEVLKGMA